MQGLWKAKAEEGSGHVPGHGGSAGPAGPGVPFGVGRGEPRHPSDGLSLPFIKSDCARAQPGGVTSASRYQDVGKSPPELITAVSAPVYGCTRRP